MIKMSCGYCNKKYDLNDSTKLTIDCSICGGRSMRFNKNVKLYCKDCDTEYVVKKGETVNLSHKPRCFSKVFLLSVEEGNESLS